MNIGKTYVCVCIGGRWRKGWRWRRENPIIFNNKECYIKGRTFTAFHFCVATEIRSGTMRHIGVHDFYQFNYWNLNLKWWGRGRRKDLRLHTAGAAVFFRRPNLWKWSSMRDWKLSQNVAHVSAPPGSQTESHRLEIKGGSFGNGWCLHTNCEISLTSLVSLLLIEENGPLMGIQLILEGVKC